MNYYNDPYICSPTYWSSDVKRRNITDTVDPKDYPYQIGSVDFKDIGSAEAYAKKLASEEHEDVVIKQRVSVVRFPLPDLKVESLVLS